VPVPGVTSVKVHTAVGFLARTDILIKLSGIAVKDVIKTEPGPVLGLTYDPSATTQEVELVDVL